MEPSLLGGAATPPVVFLTGARQTGKAGLARRLFPDHGYVTFGPAERNGAGETRSRAAGGRAVGDARLRRAPPVADEPERPWGPPIPSGPETARPIFSCRRAGAFRLADVKWTGRPSVCGPAIDWREFLPGTDDDQE